MSDIFFKELALKKPSYQLETGGLFQGQMTGRQIEGIEDLLLKIKPGLILLFGDTNTTLAGAISASKLNLPIVHVEAGLRSYNRTMPEEINRVIVDSISSLLFAPSASSVNNLLKEGVEKNNIFNVGDIMFDSVLYFSKYAKEPSFVTSAIKSNEFILCTIHRNFNTDNILALTNIFTALTNSNKKIILPLHPRTKKILAEHKILIGKNIQICNPVGYFEMLWLIINSSLVITDSGGLQKEAFFLKKPCVVLRQETEWIELVNFGVNILVGSDVDLILNSIFNQKVYPINLPNIYGAGNTSKEIVQIMKSRF
jgi:UDP-GlcNAc3NAcA epimerase